MQNDPELKPETVTAAALGGTALPPVTGGAPKPAAGAKPETEPKPETETPALLHNGRACDPARYRLNADGTLYLNRHGRPMPRGGRKKGTGAQTATGTGTAAETAPKPEPSYIPTEPPPEPKPETGTETGNGAEVKPGTAPEVVTPPGARRAAARAGTRLLYTGTGILTGNPEEAVPPPGEDKELQDTAAYVMESGGWDPSPLVAFGVLLVSYAIIVASRPKNSAAIRRRLKSLMQKGGEKPAEFTPSPGEKPAPAAAAAPSAPVHFIAGFGAE
jgi:hypothetical protein